MRFRTSVYIIAAVLLAAPAIPACRRGGGEAARFERLVDLLDRRGVAASPFLAAPAAAADLNPVSAPPLERGEHGRNPFGLKRRLSIGTLRMNILFAPPPSVYRFDLDLPETAVLEFGMGIVRDANYERRYGASAGASTTAVFSVILERSGERQVVFEESLALPPREEARTLALEHRHLALPSGGRRARLLLSVQGDEGVYAFWRAPVVYAPAREGLNVILVSIDTLRADRVGCYGYDRPTTPTLDALARHGAVFLRTYAPSPWTLPSHASLFTGLNVSRHQVAAETRRLDPALPTLASELKKSGRYGVAMTGGGFVSAEYGFEKGFDAYRQNEWGGIFAEDAAGRLGESVSEWLEHNADKPFFLFLHTYQPHTPYDSPEPFPSTFLPPGERARVLDPSPLVGGKPGVFKPLPEADCRNASDLYDAAIRYTDEALIAPLTSKLRDLGLFDRTLLVVTSDHGEEFYEHGSWMHGQDVYDESLKVPLIVKFPGDRHAGRRIESIVRLTDVMPTILEVVGAGARGHRLDGRSLLPLLEGRETGDREFLAELAANRLGSRIPARTAINAGRVKLILNAPYADEDLAFFTAPPPERPQIEVYRLDEDPGETRNVAEADLDTARRLVRRIETLLREARRHRAGEFDLGEGLREQLRALGYID